MLSSRKNGYLFVQIILLMTILANGIDGTFQNHAQISTYCGFPALDSFDTVIIDLDGTLLDGSKVMNGVKETLEFLQEKNKKIIFVTNNSVFPRFYFQKLFSANKISINAKDLVLPADAILSHLKDQKLDGKVYAMGSSVFLGQLKHSGLDIMTGPNFIPEDLNILSNLSIPDPRVKAVIAEFDPNINWIKLQQALMYLKSPHVQFFVGSGEDTIEFGPYRVIGPQPFVNILIQYSKRHPMQYAKPGELMAEYIFKTYQIQHPSRCLVIGDSFSTDMAFAARFGFQKLLVSSGKSKPSNVDYYLRPDYCAESVGELGKSWKENLDMPFAYLPGPYQWCK